MRHQKKGRKLGRDASHRKALLENLARDLIRHEKLETTEAKAKELRRVVEPLVNIAKVDNLYRRRRAFNILRDKELVHKLFTEIAPRMEDRAGGYTRIIKTRNRNGDNAEMAIIELV